MQQQLTFYSVAIGSALLCITPQKHFKMLLQQIRLPHAGILYAPVTFYNATCSTAYVTVPCYNSFKIFRFTSRKIGI